MTFRREVYLSQADLPREAIVRLSDDTRYKLVINGKRVTVAGLSILNVQVLRFFPGVNAGIPFPRTTAPGLTVSGRIGPDNISTSKDDSSWRARVETDIHYASTSPMDLVLHVRKFPFVAYDTLLKAAGV